MNIWKILRRVTISSFQKVNKQPLFYHFIWGSPSLEKQRDWVEWCYVGLLPMPLFLLTCPWQTFSVKHSVDEQTQLRGQCRAEGAMEEGHKLQSCRGKISQEILLEEVCLGGPDTGCFLTWSQPCLLEWVLTPRVQHHILMSRHPALNYSSLLETLGLMSRSLAMCPTPSVVKVLADGCG